jgi:hypothetical protein
MDEDARLIICAMTPECVAVNRNGWMKSDLVIEVTVVLCLLFVVCSCDKKTGRGSGGQIQAHASARARQQHLCATGEDQDLLPRLRRQAARRKNAKTKALKLFAPFVSKCKCQFL